MAKFADGSFVRPLGGKRTWTVEKTAGASVHCMIDNGSSIEREVFPETTLEAVIPTPHGLPFRAANITKGRH